MFKWISYIVATVIAGVLVWYLTQPSATSPPPSPSPTLSFLEEITGEYNLREWKETNRPVTMGVSVNSGELTINQFGNTDWELAIWDSGLHPQSPPAGNRSRIKCGGSVISSTRELHWVAGGQRNVAVDWVNGIESVREMVWLGFCGGNIRESAPFKLHYEQPSTGRATLEMNNSEGVFFWEKTSPF